MEKTIFIKEQFPAQTREYTAFDGTQKVFHTRGFLMTDGVDEFYAELRGDAALSVGEFDRTVPHRLQCAMQVRPYQTQAGETRYQTQIVINKLY